VKILFKTSFKHQEIDHIKQENFLKGYVLKGDLKLINYSAFCGCAAQATLIRCEI
jgi:hypothetical protein